MCERTHENRWEILRKTCKGSEGSCSVSFDLQVPSRNTSLEGKLKSKYMSVYSTLLW